MHFFCIHHYIITIITWSYRTTARGRTYCCGRVQKTEKNRQLVIIRATVRIIIILALYTSWHYYNYFDRADNTQIILLMFQRRREGIFIKHTNNEMYILLYYHWFQESHQFLCHIIILSGVWKIFGNVRVHITHSHAYGVHYYGNLACTKISEITTYTNTYRRT